MMVELGVLVIQVLTMERFMILPLYGSEIIAITSKGVYVSTNGGRNWSVRYSGPKNGDFQSISTNGSELLATTTKGLYVSKNGGRNWNKRS